jgi:AraC family transcriptional regulator
MEPARFEDRKAFLVAGSVATYQMPNIEGIPEQWRKFGPLIGKIPGQVGSTTYGICFNMDGSGKMDYMCGVEVAERLPEGLSVLQIDAQRYAVFEHRGHISKIKSTWMAIFEDWAPDANEKIAPRPQLEVYGSDFTPETGPVEIWIPVAEK